MAREKDFYGKDIAEVIERACKDLGASREELDIEVIETGSAGIFGLCRKKAHIRVKRRGETVEAASTQAEPTVAKDEAAIPTKRPAKKKVERQPVQPVDEDVAAVVATTPVESAIEVSTVVVPETEKALGDEEREQDSTAHEEEPSPATVSAESLEAIQADLIRLLTLMGLPSEVQVNFEDGTVLCTIAGPHEEHLVGPEGRTLDSLQYLLRKMVATYLPDRVMLALDAGNFRERRGEELKARAIELAEQVKADGKTQAIPALNPSERRIVHMALQEDKGVRSRSVGEGLFKKVLIYKPGKGRRPAPRKRRGGQGGRSTED